MKILFKNGTIIDGTGSAPFTGDLLIEDDRILAVGGTVDESADQTVDLTGKQICPGLIDAHSHNDFFYDREDAEKFYRPFIEQGITTQITGNCSFSPFGAEPDTPYKDKLGGGLFQTQNPGSFAAFATFRSIGVRRCSFLGVASPAAVSPAAGAASAAISASSSLALAC